MSALSEAPAPAASAGPPSCAHCRAPLEEDQEWCLECGSARTLIHPAPDWRIPLAIVGLVVVAAVVAFAIALTNLSSQANRVARATATTATTAPAQTATAPAPATKAPTRKLTIAGWPTGLAGWTVVLAQRHFQAKAENVAREFEGTGIPTGVLNSSRHPSMIPGFWIVFSGRYPDQAAAQAAAAKLRAEGHPRAHAREVAPPGGI